MDKVTYNSKLFGYFTGFIHLVLIVLVYLITIFSFDITILTIIFLTATFLIVLNKMYKDCPLSIIEEKTIGNCVVNTFNKLFPIEYDKNRRHEVQLQYIFVIWTILATKILFSFLQKDLINYVNIKYTHTDISKLFIK